MIKCCNKEYRSIVSSLWSWTNDALKDYFFFFIGCQFAIVVASIHVCSSIICRADSAEKKKNGRMKAVLRFISHYRRRTRSFSVRKIAARSRTQKSTAQIETKELHASTSAPDEFLTWFHKRVKWKTRRRVNRKIARPRYRKFANQAKRQFAKRARHSKTASCNSFLSFKWKMLKLSKKKNWIFEDTSIITKYKCTNNNNIFYNIPISLNIMRKTRMILEIVLLYLDNQVYMACLAPTKNKSNG